MPLSQKAHNKRRCIAAPPPFIFSRDRFWPGFEQQRNFITNSCQSRFSGVYLVFEVFQDILHSNKDNPNACWNATLSCPLTASNYASLYLVPILECYPVLSLNSLKLASLYLVPISFWMPREFQGNAGSFLSRFTGVHLVFEAFQAKVAHFCPCLVYIKMPVLICILHYVIASFVTFKSDRWVLLRTQQHVDSMNFCHIAEEVLGSWLIIVSGGDL